MTTPNFASGTVWTGDNLPVMRGINSACIDLIYLDPPFNSNEDYAAPIGSQAAGAAFKDTWTLSDIDVYEHGELAERSPAAYAVIAAARQTHGKSAMSYLIMMAVRLIEMRRILKDTGSIYLHCDPTMSHYLKILLDSVFGSALFQNEVVWKRQSSHNRAKRWGPVHDTILFYAKRGFTWNRLLLPLDKEYIDRFYRHSDDFGRYQVSDLTGPGTRAGDTGKPWQGVDPTKRGRHWEVPPDRAMPDWFIFPKGYEKLSAQERLDVLDQQGLIYWPKRGAIPRFKRYLTKKSGAPINDMVLDIKPLSAKSREKTGYPTQKPLALLERIIEASSNEGDIVFDPFCGCATTLVAADRLNRQWAGIDLSPLAVKLVDQRIRDDRGALWGGAIVLDKPPLRTDFGKLPNYRTHRHRLYGEQEGVCVGCDTHFPFKVMEVDHILPRSKGGSDHYENLQLLCTHCNKSKGSKTMAEWRAMQSTAT
ncbi:MAG: DNA methyltransferase [Chloroflexi bacterium]|nr:DNA methyltransferase [Chloroflexota bacterium]MCY4246211.1 DNA methyltransferase [Chloroflexota bacterium]